MNKTILIAAATAMIALTAFTGAADARMRSGTFVGPRGGVTTWSAQRQAALPNLPRHPSRPAKTSGGLKWDKTPPTKVRPLIGGAGFSMCLLARIAALVAALLFFAADAASAQGLRRGPWRPLSVCIGDYQRLCPGVIPGGGRIMTCLNAQAEKLSQACFQALAERGLALTAALRLCRADYDRLCSGVPLGRGQALACLLDNRGRLSPACRNALAAHGFEPNGESE